MTIAIAVKVDDGIVFASDSAGTLGWPDPASGSFYVQQIYNNATKIFKLHKHLPLGAVTWGLGSIGRSSLKILAKDFRANLMSGKTGFSADKYTMEQVARDFKTFMFDQHYQQMFAQVQGGERLRMGFMVAGYSAGESRGEVWHLLFDRGDCYGPTLILDQDVSGLRWEGTPLPLRRLVLGCDPNSLEGLLRDADLAPQQVSQIMDACRAKFAINLVHDSMPVKDAIDLAMFLEEVVAQYTRFCDGPNSVGGPADVAVMTKYEGFKWVRRKHFYDPSLNPPYKEEEHEIRD